MATYAEKSAAFRTLHERPGAFVIPNPWDAGTARLLASLGFEALATTSLGLANTLGRGDGASVSARRARRGAGPGAQRAPAGYSPLNVGSRTSRSQSPVRLITIEVIMSTTPGQVEIHHAESR